jgi:hypothetical protein
MSPEYCISQKRELSKTELELIVLLLTDSGLSELLFSAKNLKVVVSCGYGVCPSVLFGNGTKVGV